MRGVGGGVGVGVGVVVVVAQNSKNFLDSVIISRKLTFLTFSAKKMTPQKILSNNKNLVNKKKNKKNLLIFEIE